MLGVSEREVDFPTHLGFVKMFILVQTSVFCLLEHNETATENENNIEKEEVNKNHRWPFCPVSQMKWNCLSTTFWLLH